MGQKELDEAARSFRFDECLQREGLNKVLSEHAELRDGGHLHGERLTAADEIEGSQ